MSTLYHKYRPTEFSEVKGNDNVIATIEGYLNNKKTIPHAFLFTGQSGCGKTTMGRILAKKLGAEGQDFRELDSAVYRGIDDVRDIRKQSQYKPVSGKSTVWLLDECHKLGGDAQTALLKILEDTPPKVYFILCTTEPQKLLPTVKKRCSHFEVATLNDNEMGSLLKKVLKKEKEKVDKDIIAQIIEDSLGSARDALQILDQVLVVDPEKRMEVAKKKAEELVQSIELCRALLGQGGSWKKVSTILVGLKTQDPEGIRRQVMSYAQSVLLKGDNNRAAAVLEEFIEPFYNSGFPGLTFACYSVIKG